MGGGIAQLAADQGLPARMKDIEPKALAHGYAAAAAVWREAVQKRRLTPREMTRKMDLLSGTLDYSGFRRCDVTIEAVVEKLAVKRAVLQEWEEAVPRTAIFASNTSTLPITEIAVGAVEPGRVAGMHFFNPVHRMPLVEVIRGEPHDRRDGRDDLRAGEDPREDAGRGPGRARIPRQPHPGALPLRGRAPPGRGLPDRGRGRGDDALRHAGRPARAPRRRRSRRRGQGAARCSRRRSPSA